MAARDQRSLLLAAVAALLWLAVPLVGFWLEGNRDAPIALVITTFTVALVVLPFTVGAAVTWARPAGPHQLRTSAWAAAAAQWAWLVAGSIVSLGRDSDRQMYYLRNEWFEAIAVLAIFGVAGAIMGWAGGAVAAHVRARLSMRGASPSA